MCRLFNILNRLDDNSVTCWSDLSSPSINLQIFEDFNNCVRSKYPAWLSCSNSELDPPGMKQISGYLRLNYLNHADMR